jgi:hypothetical protein
MKKIISLLVLLFFTSISYGQQLSEREVDKVNSMIFESLSKENFIKMNRVTSGGKLASCELEYQYTYRDVRKFQGKPVMLVGSFSMMYFKGKSISYAFKIVPSVSDVKTQTWSFQYPEYSDVFLNNQSIEKYKSTEFKCSTNGKCVGYSDPQITMTKLVSTKQPFDGEVKFSLEKGGMDTSFLFSSLLPKDQSVQERRKFNNCMVEILEQISKDLESIK